MKDFEHTNFFSSTQWKILNIQKKFFNPMKDQKIQKKTSTQWKIKTYKL